MKYLIIGDVHAEAKELGDCEALIDLIINIAGTEKATVVFLGDQYHNFALVNAFVQDFWHRTFERIKFNTNIPECICLVGNHDIPGDGSSVTSMISHVTQCTVVKQPVVINNILFVPYIKDNQQFVDACNFYPNINTVVCHTTFEGSSFDNGFYAPHAIDPNLIPQKEVIVGHIHKPQTHGKVSYIGAPRWKTLSDANIERAIWLYDIDENGVVQSKVPYNTGAVCRQIFYFEDTPTSPLSLTPDTKNEYRIDIKGPDSFIQERKALFDGWAKVRTFKTNAIKPKLSESEGIKKSFDKWTDSYVPRFGTDKAELNKMVKERIVDGF